MEAVGDCPTVFGNRGEAAVVWPGVSCVKHAAWSKWARVRAVKHPVRISLVQKFGLGIEGDDTEFR